MNFKYQNENFKALISIYVLCKDFEVSSAVWNFNRLGTIYFYFLVYWG